MANKWLPNSSHFYCRWYSDNGITLVSLSSTEIVGPLGMVWGMASGRGRTGVNTFQSFGSHVQHFARRCGVRSFLNRHLLSNMKFDLITSQDATAHGEKFMRATGYKQVNGLWMLTRDDFARYWRKKFPGVNF